jgi:hypothetical protein
MRWRRARGLGKTELGDGVFRSVKHEINWDRTMQVFDGPDDLDQSLSLF